MKNKILFIVPHADDEVLGFGGTIAKLVENNQHVTVTILQAPNDDRSKQQINSANAAKDILGYHELIYLPITNTDFANDTFKTLRSVEDSIKNLQPDIIYTTSKADNHQDHKTLHRAVSVACRPVGFSKIREIYAGEVISSYEQSYASERNFFEANVYEPLTRQQLDKKIEAIKVYTTEIRDYPHPRSPKSIEAKAISRGCECMSEYAEAFMLLRKINYA